METTPPEATDFAACRRSDSRRAKRVLLFIACTFLLLVLGCCTVITQPMLGTDGAVSRLAVVPSHLEAHVRMLSETCVPRDCDHTANLDRVAAYIQGEFTKAGAQVSEQVYQVGSQSYRNVIGRFGPEDGERIVVGAHYDSCGPLPAADDNASGIAGLIELAFLLQKQSPSLAVELVAYSLEEPPHFRTKDMGSARHAQALKAKGIKVRAMLALEMIGYFADEKDSQDYPLGLLSLVYPSKGNFIAVTGRFSDMGLLRRVKKAMRGATPLPVISMNAPRFVPGIDFSDHLNYWDAGYHAVMVTDSAFYRNHNYHKATDTAATLDYRRMAQVVLGVHSALMVLGQ